jgi:hypothetical protein
MMYNPLMTLSVQDEARLKILREAKPKTWVAFNEDETLLVGQGESIVEAMEAARRSGCEDPILWRIPVDWSPRIL